MNPIKISDRTIIAVEFKKTLILTKKNRYLTIFLVRLERLELSLGNPTWPSSKCFSNKQDYLRLIFFTNATSYA